MSRAYTFTRAWGALAAGVGWVILVGALVGTPITIALVIQAPTRDMPKPLVLAVGTLAGLLGGFLVGGALIVAGQRLRLAVDSLRVQRAMLERLDELVMQRPGDPDLGARGRWSELARDETT